MTFHEITRLLEIFSLFDTKFFANQLKKYNFPLQFALG